MILLTEWKEFRSPDFEELKAQLNAPMSFLMAETNIMIKS